MHKIIVLERVTQSNFSPERYLAANWDVRRVFGNDVKAAKAHFDAYGHREARYQLATTGQNGQWESAFHLHRFDRFKSVFEGVPENSARFPIILSRTALSLEAYEGESAHPTPFNFTAEIEGNPEKLYADIGAGLRDCVFSNCINVEIYPSVTTDIVIDPGSQLPFKTASLDGIGCFSVLEHVKEPWKLAAEISRVVKSGGKVFIDWPFLQPVHGYPSHFYNATRAGLVSLLADNFDIIHAQTGQHQGLDYTFTWIANGILNSIRDSRTKKRFAKMTVAQLASEGPQSSLWKEIISAADPQANETYACGNNIVGIRKA